MPGGGEQPWTRTDALSTSPIRRYSISTRSRCRRAARGGGGGALEAEDPQEPFSPYRSITFVLVNGGGPVTAAIRPSLIASELADRPVQSVASALPLPVFSAVPPSR